MGGNEKGFILKMVNNNSSGGNQGIMNINNVLNPMPAGQTLGTGQAKTQVTAQVATQANASATPQPANPLSLLIQDPLQQSERGYLNPVTGRPFQSSQPYARNLARAMQNYADQEGQTTTSFPPILGTNASRFYNEFLAYNHPQRIVNNR